MNQGNQAHPGHPARQPEGTVVRVDAPEIPSEATGMSEKAQLGTIAGLTLIAVSAIAACAYQPDVLGDLATVAAAAGGALGGAFFAGRR